MSLGIITDSFSPVCKFHGVFLQIAHRGQSPKSDEPAFRLLRVVENKADVPNALRSLESKLPGNILFQLHNNTTLICADLDRQTQADYVLSKTQTMKDAYLQYIRFLDEDFAENRRLRSEGLQDDARVRHQKYVKEYNNKGWVKFMRARQNISDDIDVIPGMHTEAEAQSRQINALKQKKAIDDGSKEADAEEPTATEEDPDSNYPDAARKKGQRYAAISMIIDDSDDMEVLLFVHAVYSDLKAAKEHVESELTELLQPLPIDVVDMYEWIFPVRMQWENNHSSQRVTDLEESWCNQELGATQMERLEAVKKNRKLKHDILKKKEMDANVQAQIAEHLGLDPDDLMRILDDPEYGAEAVIKWAQMDNVDERKALAQKARKI